MPKSIYIIKINTQAKSEQHENTGLLDYCGFGQNTCGDGKETCLTLHPFKLVEVEDLFLCPEITNIFIQEYLLKFHYCWTQLS